MKAGTPKAAVERLHALWGTVAGAARRPWQRRQRQQPPRQPHVTIVTTRQQDITPHATIVAPRQQHITTQPHYTQQPRTTVTESRSLWGPHRFHTHYPSAKATSSKAKPRYREPRYREPRRIHTLQDRTQLVSSHVDYTLAMIDINLSLQKLLDKFEQVRMILTKIFKTHDTFVPKMTTNETSMQFLCYH